MGETYYNGAGYILAAHIHWQLSDHSVWWIDRHNQRAHLQHAGLSVPSRAWVNWTVGQWCCGGWPRQQDPSTCEIFVDHSVVETHVSLALYPHIPHHPIIIPLPSSLRRPSWSICYPICVSAYLKASICQLDHLGSFVLSLSFVLVI